MNAHINHDLALALVSTCAGQGITLDTGSATHRDFVKVNTILATVEAQVKADYLTGLIGVADEVLGRIDDVVAIWSVGEARNAAWTHAQMRGIRGNAVLAKAFEDTLDGTVGFAGRGLLVPTLGVNGSEPVLVHNLKVGGEPRGCR